MSRNNGKDRFYRTLNLDEDAKNALKCFREIKEYVRKGLDKKEKKNETV